MIGQSQDEDEITEIYEVVDTGEMAYVESADGLYEYTDMPFLHQHVDSSQPPILIPQVRQQQIITVDNSNLPSYTEYEYRVEDELQVFDGGEEVPICYVSDGSLVHSIPSESKFSTQCGQFALTAKSSKHLQRQGVHFVSSSSHQNRHHKGQYVEITKTSQSGNMQLLTSSAQIQKQLATLSATNYYSQSQFAEETSSSLVTRITQPNQFVMESTASQHLKPQYVTVPSASYSSYVQPKPVIHSSAPYTVTTLISERARPQPQHTTSSASYSSAQFTQYTTRPSASMYNTTLPALNCSSSASSGVQSKYIGSLASRYLKPTTGSLQFTISRLPPRLPLQNQPKTPDAVGSPGSVSGVRSLKEPQLKAGPTPLSADYFAKKKKRQRTMRRLMPGKRKPCNCTKSQCLKLYCECFANGEFCYECNCKDCHNNLEFNGERSKAIKTSLERNPNAFKPKIGVAQKGKNADIERLHQKGCHCKKSNCLKNYCECYEAKVACTSRCKCRCCRNTEADRQVRFSDRFIAINSFGQLSPTSEDDDPLFEPDLRQNLRTQVYYYLTDDVVEATTMCLMAQAHESETNGLTEVDVIKSLCNEFGSCMNQIYDATRLAQQANERAAAEYKANLEAQDHQMYKGEEFKLPVVKPHMESSESAAKLPKDPQFYKEVKKSKEADLSVAPPKNSEAVITLLKPKKGVGILNKSTHVFKPVSDNKSLKEFVFPEESKKSSVKPVKSSTVTKMVKRRLIGKVTNPATKFETVVPKKLNLINSSSSKSFASVFSSKPTENTAAVIAEYINLVSLANKEKNAAALTTKPEHSASTVTNSKTTDPPNASTLTPDVSLMSIDVTQIPTTTASC